MRSQGKGEATNWQSTTGLIFAGTETSGKIRTLVWVENALTPRTVRLEVRRQRRAKVDLNGKIILQQQIS